jgi:hypothetical protein
MYFHEASGGHHGTVMRLECGSYRAHPIGQIWHENINNYNNTTYDNNIKNNKINFLDFAIRMRDVVRITQEW